MDKDERIKFDKDLYGAAAPQGSSVRAKSVGTNELMRAMAMSMGGRT